MLQKLDRLAESSYYGTLSMSILIGSAMGGIMAYFASEKQSLLLVVIGLLVTMGNLVSNIAQLPVKFLVRMSLVAVVVNTLIILISVFL